MIRPILTTLLLFFAFTAIAQGDFLTLKKGHKTISNFYKNSYITFQLKSGQWIQGVITKITKDSFDLKIEKIINNFFGPPDTVHFSGFHYAVNDVYAMPKKGLAFHYEGNELKIDMGGGHQHFYWVKSGWIFRAGALGYAGLAVVNGMIDNDIAAVGPAIGIAAGVFLGGWLLEKWYRITLRLGGKYRLESSL